MIEINVWLLLGYRKLVVTYISQYLDLQIILRNIWHSMFLSFIFSFGKIILIFIRYYFELYKVGGSPVFNSVGFSRSKCF